MDRKNEGQSPTQTIILAHNRNKTTDCEDIDHRSYAKHKQFSVKFKTEKNSGLSKDCLERCSADNNLKRTRTK